MAAADKGFSDYRLAIGGLVERPMSLSLIDIRKFPSRTKITRHDCVEGVERYRQVERGSPERMLETAHLKPNASFIVFYCADPMEDDGIARYYESIDLEDAFTRRRYWLMN
jgi:DMSO/TMAO reductase YedYZ molybdopterin-dependent catalytic subunit